MAVSVEDLLDLARREARRRGFRSVGIYHLLWAARTLAPEIFESWLQHHRVEPVPFAKMLENVLRPRRAGGGVPRDRQEAILLEEAITESTRVASEHGHTPGVQHLGAIWQGLSENPIVSLCERFCLDWHQPD